MAVFNYWQYWLLGVVFATPPKYNNLVIQFLDILKETSTSTSFIEFVPHLKIATIILGYFFIINGFVLSSKMYHKKVETMNY